jgi:hypothetical protein
MDLYQQVFYTSTCGIQSIFVCDVWGFQVLIKITDFQDVESCGFVTYWFIPFYSNISGKRFFRKFPVYSGRYKAWQFRRLWPKSSSSVMQSRFYEFSKNKSLTWVRKIFLRYVVTKIYFYQLYYVRVNVGLQSEGNYLAHNFRMKTKTVFLC